MLSLTICGGLATPWARTVGACMASARPTAVVKAEAASNWYFMITSPLASRCEIDKGRFDRCRRKVTGAAENSWLPFERLRVYLSGKQKADIRWSAAGRPTSRISAFCLPLRYTRTRANRSQEFSAPPATLHRHRSNLPLSTSHLDAHA